jgi:hypothetical protein
MSDGKIVYPKAFGESQTSAADGPPFLWEFLRGAFGPSIMPTDIDGTVERNGKSLIYEKKQSGVRIPEGQWRLLDDWNRNLGHTIFIVWMPDLYTIEKLSIWKPHFCGGEEGRAPFPADAKSVWQHSNTWFRWANGEI